MHRIPIVAIVAVAWMLAAPWEAAAQSLLERLEQRLGETIVAEPLPEPPPAPLPPSESALLGVRVLPVTEAAVRQYRLGVGAGALITQIEAGSPADKVGLPLGGAIVAMNGQRIDGPQDLVRFVRAAQPEQQVELSYYQGRRLFRKTIRLGRANTTPASPNPAIDPSASPPTRSPPARSGPSLEQQLGGIGERPLLGRIGRALDQFVGPDGVQLPPATGQNEDDGEVVALRKQVQLLQAQVQQLRRRLAELEKKVATEP